MFDKSKYDLTLLITIQKISLEGGFVCDVLEAEASAVFYKSKKQALVIYPIVMNCYATQYINGTVLTV